MALSEIRVPKQSVVSHHIPHLIAVWGIYTLFSDRHSQSCRWLRARHDALPPATQLGQAMDGWIKMNYYDKLVDDCIQFYIGNIPFKYLGRKIDRLTACWEDVRQSVICPTNLFTSTYFGI